MSSVKSGIWIQDSLMYKIGLKNGDKIVSINDDSVTYFEKLGGQIILGKKMDLERDGQKVHIDLPERLIGMLVESKRKRGLLLQRRVPTYVGEYNEKDTAYGKVAGLKHMDKIVAVDSVPVEFYDQMVPLITAKSNATTVLTILRGSDTIRFTSKVNGDGKIGIPLLDEEEYSKLGVFNTVVKKYGFFAAFPAGVRKTGEQLQYYIDQFKLILNPKTEAYKGVGGFKAIGSVFPTVWDWESFWNITAFLSIILAFMNLLPIPALDGGHVMFTLYEMISGRKPNEKFLEYAQMVGMILLLGLMLYANLNDWLGWGK
jgi:regulator of sigma E protease